MESGNGIARYTKLFRRKNISSPISMNFFHLCGSYAVGILFIFLAPAHDCYSAPITSSAESQIQQSIANILQAANDKNGKALTAEVHPVLGILFISKGDFGNYATLSRARVASMFGNQHLPDSFRRDKCAALLYKISSNCRSYGLAAKLDGGLADIFPEALGVRVETQDSGDFLFVFEYWGKKPSYPHDKRWYLTSVIEMAESLSLPAAVSRPISIATQNIISSSNVALSALRRQDMSTFASFVHPVKGVKLTIDGTGESDILNRNEIAGAIEGNVKRIWGVTDADTVLDETLREFLDFYLLDAKINFSGKWSAAKMDYLYPNSLAAECEFIKNEIFPGQIRFVWQPCGDAYFLVCVCVLR